MKTEEFIKLMWKRALEHQRSRGEKGADEIINEISRNLYTGLKYGTLRRLTVRSLKEILSPLPQNPMDLVDCGAFFR